MAKDLSIIDKLKLLSKLNTCYNQVMKGIQMKSLTTVLVAVATLLAGVTQMPVVNNALASLLKGHAHVAFVFLFLTFICGLVHDPKKPVDLDALKDAAKKVAPALVLCVLLLVPCFAHAQVAPAAPALAQNFYAGGLAYNGSGTPQLAGNLVYGHRTALTDAGTWIVSNLDIVPTGSKPFTATTNIGAGVAQKVMVVEGLPVYALTSTGLSINGPNTGWKYDAGFATAFHPFKSHPELFVMPQARFIKSSVNNGSGYQPIVAVDIGFSK